MKEYSCNKCGSTDLFIKKSGNNVGLYCGDCGSSDMSDLMLSNASAGLSEANDVLEEYQSLYEQAQKAEMKSDKTLFSADGKEQTAAKWISDYAKAVMEHHLRVQNQVVRIA